MANKPYKCLDCGQGFTFYSGLKIHARVDHGKLLESANLHRGGSVQDTQQTVAITQVPLQDQQQQIMNVVDQTSGGFPSIFQPSTLQSLDMVHQEVLPTTTPTDQFQLLQNVTQPSDYNTFNTVNTAILSNTQIDIIPATTSVTSTVATAILPLQPVAQDMQTKAPTQVGTVTSTNTPKTGDSMPKISSLGKTIKKRADLLADDPNRPHRCPKCNKGFRKSSLLRQHERIHLSVKPHICEFCNKGFTTPWNLKMHIRTHTGYKPYLCSTCGKGFAQTGALQNHYNAKDTNCRRDDEKSQILLGPEPGLPLSLQSTSLASSTPSSHTSTPVTCNTPTSITAGKFIVCFL